MALVNAKCTGCGTNLEVDGSQDAAICKYCGAAFVVEKAVNNYNIANAQIISDNININLTTEPTENALLEYAGRIVNHNPKEAIETYKNVLKTNPASYMAWFGIAEADVVLTEKGEFDSRFLGTREAAFGIFIVGTNEQAGVTTIPKYSEEFNNAYINALRYAPLNERAIVEQFYNKNVTEAKKQAEEYVNKKTEKIRAGFRSNIILAAILFAAGLLLVFINMAINPQKIKGEAIFVCILAVFYIGFVFKMYKISIVTIIDYLINKKMKK
jgi:DNA-directed RNA polymerase subunit RPC12/RpoP